MKYKVWFSEHWRPEHDSEGEQDSPWPAAMLLCEHDAVHLALFTII